MIQRFVTGFKYVFRGLQVAKQIPGLRKLILIPFLLDCLLLFIGFSAGIGWIQKTAAATALWILGGNATGYAEFLYYPILAVFGLCFFAILIYVVYLTASVIASPFYALIAEKVLVQNKIIADEPMRIGQMFKTAIAMLIVSLKRVLLLFAIGVILLVLSLIPGVNLIAAYCAFVILAVDSAEFSFEARQMKLSQRLQEIRRHIPEFLGMGAFIALTALVPGLILLAMPFAVVGAAETLYPRKTS